MKLVLDTNVVMELLHYRDPRSTALMQAITDRSLVCHTNRHCLAELLRVLAYPQFALDEAAQHRLYEQYRALATEADESNDTPIDIPLPRCRDADDQKFMELAARSQADLLITRDKELLRLARSRARPAPFAILIPERAILLLDTDTHIASEQPT
jgi:putative PIN family toxin of toxin-antitoxin system